nr:MAG TPA: hypothetical protein [Caudoviricetes sp.]
MINFLSSPPKEPKISYALAAPLKKAITFSPISASFISVVIYNNIAGYVNKKVAFKRLLHEFFFDR